MSIEMIPDSPIDIKDIAPAAPVFESFAANLPDTADGFAPFDSALPDDAGMLFPSDAKAVAREKKTKRVKMSKKMQKTMDKLKGKASTFPVLWFHSMAKEHPEWELDEDERDILTDSIETVFEVLDIEIQIEPLSVELTSIWWVLSYPILAFAFLFFSKKSMIVEKEKQNENPT